MSQYLLSAYAVGGDPHASTSPEDMQAFMERVSALGPEIKASGTFVSTGRLDDSSTPLCGRPKSSARIGAGTAPRTTAGSESPALAVRPSIPSRDT